jgi:hypothetical protein
MSAVWCNERWQTGPKSEQRMTRRHGCNMCPHERRCHKPATKGSYARIGASICDRQIRPTATGSPYELALVKCASLVQRSAESKSEKRAAPDKKAWMQYTTYNCNCKKLSQCDRNGNREWRIHAGNEMYLLALRCFAFRAMPC